MTVAAPVAPLERIGRLPGPRRHDARSAGRWVRSPRRATSSACGATWAPARRTWPRRSGAGLGVTATITSPSFILMAEYEGRLPLFHMDLYRLADAADALAGGLIDDRQIDGPDPRRVAGAADRRAARRPARRGHRRVRRRAAPRSPCGPATERYRRYLEAVA